MFALNQGEVCTCPVAGAGAGVDLRPVHGAGGGPGQDRSWRGTRSIPNTMIGAQASNDQLEKILSYIEIGKKEGAQGADRRRPPGPSGRAQARATTSSRRSSRATTGCGSSRRRSSGRCVARHQVQGHGRRAVHRQRHALRAGRRGVEPGRQHLLSDGTRRSRPAGCGPTAIMPIRRTRRSAATSSPGIGRENHRMMLDHYQQTKNLLVSYSPKKLGFF